eukprot:Skav229881  [mRNA]  locus=scaffold247:354658:356938:+ [translate_table: standard]
MMDSDNDQGKPAHTAAYKAENVEDDSMPKQKGGPSGKEVRNLHDELCIGGMRNPAKSVRRLSMVKATGERIRALWDEFAESHPATLEVAKNYGKTDNAYDSELVRLWRGVLCDHLPKVSPDIVAKHNYEFTSPLVADLWDAWQKESKDPDKHIAAFARHGVPLGMDKEIPVSGIFPEVTDQEEINQDPLELFELLRDTKNYTSVSDQPEEAAIEVQRLIDVVQMVRSMWSSSASRWDTSASSRSRPDDFEFYTIDLTDAFCHFPIAREELRHCVTPDVRAGVPGGEDGGMNGALLWISMLFGFKSAPLLMGRLSAAIGRLLQSTADDRDTQLQVYVDDLLVAALGSREKREHILACWLYTLSAFGVQVNLKKGEGGRRVKWIGCQIEVPPPEGNPPVMVLGVAKQMIDQILEVLHSWQSKGMGSLKELKSTTGRLSWVAGIVPRIRWTVNILYAVLKEVEREQAAGDEHRRASNRADSRPKVGLFPIKRLGGVDKWILKLLDKPERFLVRVEKLIQPKVTLGIITDACPSGFGSVHPSDGGLRYTSSIGSMGASADEQAVLIRADSTVALAMCQRLSSPTPSLNFLASEISLRLEMYKIDRLVQHHISGKMNEEADWLSRLVERGNAPRPAGLEGVTLRRAPAWDEPEKFLLPPPRAQGGDEIRFVPTAQIFESL